jgi:hypothetical protein
MQATGFGDGVDHGDVVATLDAVELLHGHRVEIEARLFELAAHFADLHPGHGLPTSQALSRCSQGVLPGTERAVRLGGVGTPWVAEFAYAELGARMGMGTWAARRFVADALDVRHRLPLIWARLRRREARVGFARLVAGKTRHLSVAAAGVVDAAMVPFVDGSLPWGRFEARLDGKVVAADPALAAEREAERVAEQFAKRTRSTEAGTAGFYVRSTVGVIARLDATISFLADALRAFGDTDCEELRRVKAVAVLANPSRAVELLAAFAARRSRSLDLAIDNAVDDVDVKLPLDEPAEPLATPEYAQPDALERMDAFARRVGFRPTRLPGFLSTPANVGLDKLDQPVDAPVFRFDWSKLLPPLTLNLHFSGDDLADEHRREQGGVVRWEEGGPVTAQFVHDHLRPLHAYRIQPVLDLAGQAPADGYEIPDRHRRAVRLRTPADCFPYSCDTTSQVDVDHTRPYDHTAVASSGGEQTLQSRLENYGPLGRFHHRIKTHGTWTLRQPFDGLYLWRDPHGQVYLVDHTGTHKITPSGATSGAATSYDPDIDVIPTDTVIEVDFAAWPERAWPQPAEGLQTSPPSSRA